MPNFIHFILLAYSLGPIVSIPYGLNLGLSPTKIFIILSILYITPLPILLKIFEFGGHHKKIYRKTIFTKFSEVTKKNIEDVMEVGDEIKEKFEEKLGYLGFYLAIALFTFLFGIFWAAFFAYLLKVKRKRAILSIALGVLIGNTFWLLIISCYRPIPIEIYLLIALLIIPLLIYGRRREIQVIRWVASRTRIRKIKSQN